MIVAFTLLLAASSHAAEPRVVGWQARAEAHEAKQQWCDALFYRGHALAVRDDQETRYRAFLDAYAADQLRTAHALVQELRIDMLLLDNDARAKVDNIVSDLESLETLDDSSCTHAPVCGDDVIEGAEMCDGDASCTAECSIVVVAPRGTEAPTVAPTPAPTPAPIAAPALDANRPETMRVAGMVATGAGLVAAGAGAAVAFVGDRTIADPLSTGPFKERALDVRTGGWVALGVGAVVAVGGAIVLGVSETTHDVDDRAVP